MRFPRQFQSANRSALGVVFGIGVFGMAAQSLLFRSFLGIFEGSELGIAWFFSTWLVWVAVGAMIARGRSGRGDGSGGWSLEFLSLCYVPAYFLQEFLTTHARDLAGIQPYELFPIARMLPTAFLANAPVSLCTGFLFTRACAWRDIGGQNAVSLVYAAEAAGGFAGGAGVTLLLAAGVSEELVLALVGLLLTVFFGVYRFFRRAYATAMLPALAILALVLAGGARAWETKNRRDAWERLMPSGSYRGCFVTPQARYLYGEYNGQFTVMAWQSIADTVPGTEEASQTMALLLAQNPMARRFLVIGPGGISVCRRLRDLPQAEDIAWADPDPAYPAGLLRVLPPDMAGDASRIRIIDSDIRRHLRETTESYDLIVLSFPAATTLTLNRYLTREFFVLAKQRLAASGVIGVRVAGGENFMGDEMVNAGASVYATLGSVFRRLAVKPGEESWIIASDSDTLSESPAVLRDRYRSIPGAASLYPPEALLSLYLPDRVEFQTRQYRTAMESDEGRLLLNTDRHPRALLHALLLAGREMGAAGVWAERLRRFAADGLPVVPAGVALVVLLRFVFVRRRVAGDADVGGCRCSVVGDRLEMPQVAEGGPDGDNRNADGNRPLPRETDNPQPSTDNREPMPVSGAPGSVGRRGPFDDHFLVFTTGAAGMGASLVMMFMYQSAFGVMFLHAGLISALFMLGLFLGAAMATRILTREGIAARVLLPVGLSLHAALVLSLMILPADAPSPLFAALFLAGGTLAGLYVPVAASSLRRGGAADGTVGAVVEWNDHLGGAAGGLLVGLLLLPMFGGAYALTVTTLLLVANFPFIRGQVGDVPGGTADRADRAIRAAGYTLFGLVAFALVTAHCLQQSEGRDVAPAFRRAARDMAGSSVPSAKDGRLSSGRTVEYFEIRNAGGRVESYIFRTDQAGPVVQGYGGPLILAVMVSADGTLQDFRLIRSDETPAYVDALAGWFRKLAGLTLFSAKPLAGVDAVTGATVSSAAILGALRQAGPGFARDVLGQDVGTASAVAAGKKWSVEVWVLAAFVAVALYRRRRPMLSNRWLLSIPVVVAVGFLLNVQYSTAHVLAALGLRFPPPEAGIAFWMVAGIPCLVLLLGNIYCGYLCPFGLLQDLMGDVAPHAWRTEPGKGTWRWARMVKFLLLAILATLFALSLDRGLASWDPLVVAFSSTRSLVMAGLLLVLLALSLVYRRFWCRNLCPAGAFLSLLNGVRLLRRWIPSIVPSRCRYGVKQQSDLDCLCCDRCRGPSEAEFPATGGLRRDSIFLVLVVATAMMVVGGLWVSYRAEGVGGRSPRGAVGYANVRDVDMARLLQKIRRGELSDHEARGYHKIEAAPVSDGQRVPDQSRPD